MTQLFTNIYSGTAIGDVNRNYGIVTSKPKPDAQKALADLSYHLSYVNTDLFDSEMQDRSYAFIINASVSEAGGLHTATGTLVTCLR